MAALDDFRIEGDTLTFNILHEDSGDGELPTFEKHVTAHVGWNEVRCATAATTSRRTSPRRGRSPRILAAGPIKIKATSGNVWPESPPKNGASPRYYGRRSTRAPARASNTTPAPAQTAPMARATRSRRRETFDGDGSCNDSHRAQVHDADHQQDRDQTRTALGCSEARGAGRIARPRRISSAADPARSPGSTEDDATSTQ